MKRRWHIWTLLLALPLLAGGCAVWWLVRTPPEWWSPPVVTADTIDLADKIEMRVLEEVHLARSDTMEWGMRLTEEQVNAWLAANLREWVEHWDGVWPERIQAVQIHLRDSWIDVGISEQGVFGGQRVITLRVAPTMNDDLLTLRIEQIAFGRIRVPGGDNSRVAGWIESFGSSGTLLDLLDPDGGVVPRIRLADRRWVRLTDLLVEDGTISVLCVTEREEIASP